MSNSHRSDGSPSGGPLPAAALDRRGPVNSDARQTGIVQPKPQMLTKRPAGGSSSSIIVSPRQKGNPVLNCIKSMPWEYGDIPADYVLGATTCALFLSLKYHRLHPEYIYNRVRNLQGKYNLRVVLCMVDIPNHEESLKELSKTSLINNVTLILCWSAAEGGRYLELFKTYENAAPTSIIQYQSSAYSDRMVDFITTPRSINKTDAVALVSQFGTIRTAVNARHEDIATITGWGDKKVQRWCTAVREPFRVQRAAKRRVGDRPSQPTSTPRVLTPANKDDHLDSNSRDNSASERGNLSRAISKENLASNSTTKTVVSRLPQGISDESGFEEAAEAALAGSESNHAAKKRKKNDDELDQGVMAALSKLRKAD